MREIADYGWKGDEDHYLFVLNADPQKVADRLEEVAKCG